MSSSDSLKNVSDAMADSVKAQDAQQAKPSLKSRIVHWAGALLVGVEDVGLRMAIMSVVPVAFQDRVLEVEKKMIQLEHGWLDTGHPALTEEEAHDAGHSIGVLASGIVRSQVAKLTDNTVAQESAVETTMGIANAISDLIPKYKPQ